MINCLVNTFLFQELEFSAIEEIAKFCTKLNLSDGEILISENEAQNYDLFILCMGSVEIVSSSSSKTSEEIVISKQDTEVFGEIAWLTRNKRTATLRCRGEVEAVRIDATKLMEYMEVNPQIGFEIMRKIANLLAKRLEQTNNLLKQILWNTKI